jgi:poly(3-hydroxybutyrate) depolymerase
VIPSPLTSVSAPPTSSGLLESWVEGWSIALRGMGEYVGATLKGEVGPQDLPRWWNLMTTREPPKWASPNEIIFEAPVARLRDFSTAKPRGLVPTLVLPPQAGHDSCIVDYQPDQSQMKTIIAAGLEHALTLDWIGATEETADATIDDYLEVIERAIDHCGGRVNLIGDCQGGWLATVYAALHPEQINTLTIAGAPIDFHAGEPVIHEVLRHLAPHGSMKFYEALVAADGGVLKGEHMLTGFVMIQPGDEVARQFELLHNLNNEQHVARYREFENWFKHTQDVPGAFYLWIVRHLFRDNALMSGSLKIGGRKVDPTAIDMPLNLLAGATDHITPPDQVFALGSIASTPEEQIDRHVTTGGHLGLFMGHEALREHWPVILADVMKYSKPAGKTASSNGHPRANVRSTGARRPAAKK